MKTSEQVAQYVFSVRNEYYEKQKKRRAAIMKALPVGAAAVTVLAAVGIYTAVRSDISTGGNSSDGAAMNTAAATYPEAGYPETGVPATGNAIFLDPYTGMEQGWDEKPIYEKYRSYTHDGHEYSCRKVSENYGDVPESRIGEKLCDVTFSTIETFSQQEFSVNGEVYEINGILPEAVTAVKYEGTNNYYAFMNRDYRPADMNALIDALDLMDTISFGSIYIEGNFDEASGGRFVYDPLPVTDEKNEIIKKFLQECGGIACETEDHGDMPYSRQIFDISADIQLAGVENHGIWFTENGYMVTNLMEWAFWFNVGSERIQQLAVALGVTEQQPFLSTYPEWLTVPLTTAAGDEEQLEIAVMYTSSSEAKRPTPATMPE